jgi:hypothetical protein
MSCCLQKTGSSQLKAPTTTHGTRDERHTMDVPFHWSIAVWKHEGCFHRFILLLHTVRKGFHIWNATPLASLEPKIKSLTIPFFHQFQTPASQIRQDVNEWVLSHEGEGTVLLAFQRGWVSPQKPDQMARCVPCDRLTCLVCVQAFGLLGRRACLFFLGETHQIFFVQSVRAARLFSSGANHRVTRLSLPVTPCAPRSSHTWLALRHPCASRLSREGREGLRRRVARRTVARSGKAPAETKWRTVRRLLRRWSAIPKMLIPCLQRETTSSERACRLRRAPFEAALSVWLRRRVSLFA